MNLPDFIQEHRSLIAASGMAAVHFAHLAWPRLVAVFPYCRDNGGAVGLARQLLFGRQAAASQPTNPKPQPN